MTSFRTFEFAKIIEINKIKNQTERVKFSNSFGNPLLYGVTQSTIHIYDAELKDTDFKAYDDNFVITDFFCCGGYLLTVGENDRKERLIKAFEVCIKGKQGAIKQQNFEMLKLRKTIKVSEEVIQLCYNEKYFVYRNRNTITISINNSLVKEMLIKNKKTIVVAQEIKDLGFVDYIEKNEIGKLDHLETKKVLFVVTKAEIMYIDIENNKKTVIEKLSEEPKCITFENSKHFNGAILGYDDGIYYYSIEGVESCVAIKGEKKELKTNGDTIAIVNENNKVQLFNRLNKYFELEKTFDNEVVSVHFEANRLFVLCKNHMLFILGAIDRKLQIETLISRNLYHLALNVSKANSDISDEYVMDVLIQYADNLYEKKEYQSSIDQFICTIPSLNPLYVIEKFQRYDLLEYLKMYFSKLYDYHKSFKDKGFEYNKHHFILYMQLCLKLENFDVVKGTFENDNDIINNLFDSKEDLIDMLVEYSQLGLALVLAKKESYHNKVMVIYVDILNDYDSAYKYLKQLEPKTITELGMPFLRKLVKQNPKEMTDILLTLSLSNQNNFATPIIDLDTASFDVSNPFFISELFLDNNEFLIQILESYSKHCLNKEIKDCVTSANFEIVHDIKAKNCADMFYTLLYKMYVIENAKQTEGQYNNKAMYVLQECAVDLKQALIVSKTFHYKEGIIWLFTKMKMINELVDYLLSINEAEYCIQTLIKYYNLRKADNSLFRKVLKQFVQLEDNMYNKQEVFHQLIDFVHSNSLLTFAEILSEVSASPFLSLGMIKEFIINKTSTKETKANENIEDIQRLRLLIENNNNELKDMELKNRIIQQTNCSSCAQRLEVPIIHFLCNHSYHEQCLENENCPKCINLTQQTSHEELENNRILDTTNNYLDQKKDNILDCCSFDEILECFSKSVFE